MWLMWMFSVAIPLGVIHSIVSGEISVGGSGASRILRLDENPVGFVIMIGALCVLEFLLVATLLRIRRDGQPDSANRQRNPR